MKNVFQSKALAAMMMMPLFAHLQRGCSSFSVFSSVHKIPLLLQHPFIFHSCRQSSNDVETLFHHHPTTSLITRDDHLRNVVLSDRSTTIDSQQQQSSATRNSNKLAVEAAENELKKALENARNIDKKYGLCTEPSQKAWKEVDELYRQIELLRQPNVVRVNIMPQQLQLQQTADDARRSTKRIVRRKLMSPISTSRNATMEVENMKGRRYFF